MKQLLYVLVVILIGVNVPALGFGFLNQAALNKCGTPMKITYVAPAYELGCWLGSPR